MMKVLHIITGLHDGGAEGVLYRLVIGDGENSHQVVSLTGPAVYGERLLAAGVPVHTLDMARGRATLNGILKLYRLLRTVRPDVIHTWMYHADLIGGLVARLSGFKKVFWCVRASNAYDFGRSPTKSLLWCCARLSSVLPAKIIYSSHAGERIHRQLGYDGRKSEIIGNGIDTAIFRPEPEARSRKRSEWGIGTNAVVIGMVARWDPLKDHETLLAALHELDRHVTQPWTCVLIGRNMIPDNRELITLIQRFNLEKQVKLLGPESDISAVMNALDIHVLSSKSEAFPNVVGEAMACGIPCVATNVGDVSLIVGTTGWLVANSDSSALAEALHLAFSEERDSAQWRARKEACRRRIIDNYGLDRMIDAYRSSWEEGLGVWHRN